MSDGCNSFDIVCLCVSLCVCVLPLSQPNGQTNGPEFLGLKQTVLDHFGAILGAYKRHTPLHIGLLSPQICTDLRGVKNPRKSAYRRKRIHPVFDI